MPKPNKSQEPEFSDKREWAVILEDLRSQFRVFGEGMAGMREDMTGMREDINDIRGRVEHLEMDMSFVKKVLPTVATKDDLKQLEKRLTTLESTR